MHGNRSNDASPFRVRNSQGARNALPIGWTEAGADCPQLRAAFSYCGHAFLPVVSHLTH